MINKEIIEYYGIKLLSGVNTHPGSGIVYQHKSEHELFNKVLDRINSCRPKMIEIGCFWALWSLLFRQKFPNGANVLVELGRRHLDVGEFNFKLNGWDFKSYHGGFFLEESGTFKNRIADLEYDRVGNEIITGGELSLKQILQENGAAYDILHLDIQGSEYKFLAEALKLGTFFNVVVGTHSNQLHRSCRKLLIDNGYKIFEEEPFGAIGGDGYLAAGL